MAIFIYQTAGSIDIVDNGGVFNGSAFPASGTLYADNGSSLGTPVFSYSLIQSAVNGQPMADIPIPAAPVAEGNYNVTLSSQNYDLFGSETSGGSDSLNFTITGGGATPTITMSAGGVYNAKPHGVTGTLTNASGEVIGVPTVRYYDSADTALSSPLPSAPTDPGSYVAVGTFAGSGQYAAAKAEIAFSVVTGATPTIAVTTPGVYTGLPQRVSASVTGVDGSEIGSATVSYYCAGDTAFADPLAGPPAEEGSFVAVASFSGNTEYAAYSTNTSYQLTGAGNTPIITVSDPGGTYDGMPFPATASVAGTGGNSVGSAQLTYFSASDAALAHPLPGPPADAGNYFVLASFPGGSGYQKATALAFFTITPANATVTVSDAGGAANGSPYPATGAILNVMGNVVGTPVFTYYLASDTEQATALPGPPTAAGTYTVVASSNSNYLAGSAEATFSIGNASTLPPGSYLQPPFIEAVNGDNIQVADLGNGYPDLIVTNGSDDDGVSILLGNGDGTFQPAQQFNVLQTPGAGQGIIAAQIMDPGDGRKDIVAMDGGNILILLNDGKGAFHRGQTFSLPEDDEVSSLLLTDRATTRPDFIVLGTGSQGLVPDQIQLDIASVFVGNGRGMFSQLPDYTLAGVPFSSSATIALANVGNGRSDLVLCSAPKLAAPPWRSFRSTRTERWARRPMTACLRSRAHRRRSSSLTTSGMVNQT